MQLDGVERRTNLWAVVGFGLLFLAGIVLWCLRTAAFVWDDSYFYLVIARNIATRGEQTFTNVFPTNGFHPLWEYLLAGYSWLVNLVWPGALANVSYALPLAIAILCGIAVQCWRLGRRLEVEPLIVAGVVVTYNFIVGMLYSEGPLFFLLLTSLMLEIAGDEEAAGRRPLFFGTLAGLTVLARLDAIFVVGLVLLVSLWKSREKLRAIMACGLCGAIVAAYVATNIYFFGGAMPVSGWMKGGFPDVYWKGLEWRGTLGIMSVYGGYRVIFGWVPLVIGLMTPLLCRQMTATQRRVLGLLWGGTAAHCLYVVLFGRSFTTWPWYYVQAILLLAVSLAILAQYLLPARGRLALVGLIGVLAAAGLVARYRSVPTRSETLPETFTERGATLMINDAPGGLAFYTDNNVIAADMLTANRPLYEKMRKAPDAFEFMFEESAKRGKPIRYVVVDAGDWFTDWLVWDPEKEEVIWNDPRAYPELVPIGRLSTTRNERGERIHGEVRVWFPDHAKGIDPRDLTNANTAE